jgi:hypothetical protein
MKAKPAPKAAGTVSALPPGVKAFVPVEGLVGPNADRISGAAECFSSPVAACLQVERDTNGSVVAWLYDPRNSMDSADAVQRSLARAFGVRARRLEIFTAAEGPGLS